MTSPNFLSQKMSQEQYFVFTLFHPPTHNTIYYQLFMLFSILACYTQYRISHSQPNHRRACMCMLFLYARSPTKALLDLGIESSRAKELHLHPLTEPYVKVSPHTALHTRPFRIRQFCGTSPLLQ